MTPHFQRADLLFDQNRYDQAVREFHLHLVEEPNDGYAHSLMAISLANIGRLDDALQHAQESIRLEPEMGYTHAALAQVELERKRYEAAAAAMDEAIRCVPFVATYHGLLAAIRLRQQRWRDALVSANQGLEYDPEDSNCLNFRALALRQLGENEAATETVRGALSQNPNDPFAHANEGWGLLETGDAKQALDHFREALRLEPEFEYARLGIIEALKSQNVVYRFLLKYLLWLGKMSVTTLWGIAVIGIVVVRFIASIGRAIPAIAPFTWLLTTVLSIGCFSIIFIRPFSNFVLLFHPLGRMAMTKDQISQGFLTAILAPAFIGFYLWSEATPGIDWTTDALLVLMLIIIPALSIHDCQRGWPRWAVIGLVLLAPCLFYLPLLTRGFAPLAVSAWVPRSTLFFNVYNIILLVGLISICLALEDVELVE